MRSQRGDTNIILIVLVISGYKFVLLLLFVLFFDFLLLQNFIESLLSEVVDASVDVLAPQSAEDAKRRRWR